MKKTVLIGILGLFLCGLVGVGIGYGISVYMTADDESQDTIASEAINNERKAYSPKEIEKIYKEKHKDVIDIEVYGDEKKKNNNTYYLLEYIFFSKPNKPKINQIWVNSKTLQTYSYKDWEYLENLK
ncbi:hypothetical protein CLPU_8c00380 [Gottschalkia purinilytica]|uniref:DUF3139 domain-containing protein n=1 Tax=Gottschalkia purinilytica TaxID=1503 RepID=A0A0L0W9P4_GOTPU|nr:hypothetical protein [Gottschalkia purinilytica]KNF08273.1 hypothetical protein CLPU_8c00380 [Gottschalkia purinilytica]